MASVVWFCRMTSMPCSLMMMSYFCFQAFLSVATGQSVEIDRQSQEHSPSKSLVLAVNVRGELRLWNLTVRKLVCECSVAPLLTAQMQTGNSALAAGDVSKSAHLIGVDVDTTSTIAAHVAAFHHDDPRARDRYAGASGNQQRVVRSYTWNSGMRCWLRASCEDYLHSMYYSTISAASTKGQRGKGSHVVERLQQQTRKLLDAERVRCSW